MNSTLQLEEPVSVETDSPRLQVEWSSRWHEFLSSIGPALSRSERRLAGEAPFGLVPLRIMIPSYVLEAFVIFAGIAIQVKVAELRPQVVPTLPNHEVIYYSGDELPRTEDLSGSEAGRSGRAGGDEAYHRTQTIKVARGPSMVQKIVDAPNLKLPASRDAVANLLAVRPDPGPPPAEGLRSSRSAPNLPTTVVAPAPNIIRDYTRNGIQLNSVIAPAPTVPRERPSTAPTLNAALIPPAPSISSDHTLVAPAMLPAVIPPAPNISRSRTASNLSLNPAVVAPAPNVPSDQTRSSPALAANVIPPAPEAVTREMSRAPVQATNAAVVPPPVSAPERASTARSRLSLPSPSVVAPPPSANLADTRRLAPGPDASKSVVPPPPQSSSGSFMGSLIGKIFGATEVVAPPPSVASKTTNGNPAPSLSNNVVPPPPAVNGASQGGIPRGNRKGMGAAIGSNVVAPPPSVGVSGGAGNPSRAAAAPYLGNPSVVPPPPSLAGAGGGSAKTGGGAGAPGGTLLANNIVPPPPSVGGGSSSTGSGLGRKGVGLGAPLNPGANLAASTNGGSGGSSGAVISSQPGSKLGVPATSSAGSVAMSPAGGAKPGLGGSGNGSSIGNGSNSGSGLAGAGSGAARSGSGRGADVNANGGISPTNGPGGAGNTPAGAPPVKGVDISGGNTIVTLPSFGDDPASPNASAPAHTPVKHSPALGVSIYSTASSAGALEPYKSLLQGEIYTTYLDTSIGTVSMEFSGPASTARAPGNLDAPVAIRADLPAGLTKSRMVLTCTLDASGNLKNIRVLEGGPASFTAKVLLALRSWKFQPAMKNNQPVEVTAILGFGIDTNDRY